MGNERLSFLEGGLPRAFEVRTVTIAAGASRAYVAAEWRDALVLVQCGDLELETSTGACWRFRHDDVLWLAEMPVRALHNPGSVDTLLVAVSRRCP